jgi:hypothetical protein
MYRERKDAEKIDAFRVLLEMRKTGVKNVARKKGKNGGAHCVPSSFCCYCQGAGVIV